MSRRRSPRLSSGGQDDAVTRLLEQVRLLTLENESLRNLIADRGLSDALPPNTKNTNDRNKERRARRVSATGPAPKAKSPNIPTDPVTPRAGGRGCSCKGNCSTRVCGCVKRSIPCAEFCRCGDELCQNSEPDKENIGDPNRQAKLSKDAGHSLTKLSKLTLTENKGSKQKHPSLEPVNKQLDQVGKPHSLFSPDATDHVFKFETTGDIEFENISLRFGDDPDAETAETAEKDNESSGGKATAGKKSKKDEKKGKDVASPLAQGNKGTNRKGRIPNESKVEAETYKVGEAMKEAVAEKTTGRKNNKNIETKKGEGAAAPVKGKKRQASKARIRNGSSESEAEDKVDDEEDEEEVAQEPVKEKTKRRLNNAKKETKKGKPVAALVKGNKRQASKTRIRSNSSDSDAEDKIDNEWEDEEEVEKLAKEKPKGRKNNTKEEAKKGKPVAAPVRGLKRKGSRARIRSSSSETGAEDKIDTEEEEQEVGKAKTPPMRNNEKVEARKGTVTGAQNNRIEPNESFDDDDDDDYAVHDSWQNNNNHVAAEANGEQMEAHVGDGESDASELSPANSNESNDLTRTIDNSMSPEAAADFNPMKPRRQLSRSPLVSRNESHTQRILDPSEILLPAPLQEEPEEEPPEPEELKETVVEDWDQHKANLIKCSKCGRTLYPHRIKKHEASCQKI